jgi:hypothetical protein
MKEKTCWLSMIKALGLCSLLILITVGCKNLNDNPPPLSENKIRIDVGEIQRQISASAGVHEENRQEAPQYTLTSSETVVSSEAKTLLIGAVVVTSRSIPYPSGAAVTTSIPEFFGNDLIDSGDFIQLINLPVTETYVEFKVPPQSAGNWQVFAVAFSTQPELVSDLSAEEHKKSAIYFGVKDQFFTAESIGNTPVPVRMQRICLQGTPPKGCASFGASLTAEPVVTASVEIVGVRANGVDYTPGSVDFPIFVRTAEDVTAAIASLETIRDEIKDSLTATSMTVRATHAENTTESDNCQALSSVTNQNEFTNTQLRTHCEVSDYQVTY